MSFLISSSLKELSFLPHQESKLKYFWYYWNHHFAMKLISLMKSTFQYFWILLYHLFLNTSILTRNLKSTWNCLTWSFIKWYFHHNSKLFDLLCESHSYDYLFACPYHQILQNSLFFGDFLAKLDLLGFFVQWLS